MSRLSVLFSPPAAHARGARHGPGRRRHHRGLRRRLHRHVGQPRPTRSPPARCRSTTRRPRRRSSPPPTCAPATRPRTGTVDIGTPARCRAPSRSTAARPSTATATTRSRQAQRRRHATAATSLRRRPGLRRRRPGQVHRHARRDEQRRSRSAPSPAPRSTATSSASTLDASAGNAYQGDTSVVHVRLERRLAGRPAGSARHGPPHRTRGLHARCSRRACSSALVLVAAGRSLGWQRYVIVSGSMTGTYDRGSLVLDEVVPGQRARESAT